MSYGRTLAVGLFLLAWVVTLALPGWAQEAAPTGQKKPLVVLTKQIAPFVMVGEDGKAKGFSIDLWRRVAMRMGRDYELKVLPDLKSMLAAISRGEGDVAIAAITITAARERQMDFSHPYFRSGLQILVRNDGGGLLSQAGEVLGSLFNSRSFRLALWTLLFIVLAAAHVIWLLERGRNEHFSRRWPRGVWDGAYWALVTISTVGYGDKVPRTHAGRAVSMVLIVVGYMAYAWFTASIAATLTVASLQNDINGPDDLRGRVVATVASSTSAAWVRQLPGARLREVERIEQAYELLARGEVDAVVYDFPALRHYLLSDTQQRFAIVGPVFKGEDYAIALPPGSALMEELNRALLDVMETGEYTRLQNKWFGAAAH
jgi:ABC-type amino acid transport substrate-binding protein